MSLAAKYTKLRKSIGGNREKIRYEETFRPAYSDLELITPPNKWQVRILSEIEFAIRLSGISDNKYDKSIEETIDLLQNKINISGVITYNDCEEAENILVNTEGLTKAAKEYELILAAHAHIDMNWQWGWSETVAVTLATFRTMLKFMDEYPEFCFSQSQASVYKIVEEYDPEMMEVIKKRIKEGRWEITAAAWVETDKNMPNTESLLNHINYTKKYLKEKWGIDPGLLQVDCSPDTFGHSANLPEINSYGNVKYYYLSRGVDGNDVMLRWRAPSGKEVLIYKEQYWYNGGITPFAGIGIIDISQRSAGLKTGLFMYGVGDHGGGPTRRDIEKAIEMNGWPVFPTFKFGTMLEFFKKAELVREKMRIIDRELNLFAPGCFTTQNRIKLGNRKCEAFLGDAQCLSALSSKLTGSKYYYNQFENSWRKVLFSQFHDILTGSCVQDAREYAMGQYSEVMAMAQTQHTNAMLAIAENIDTSFIIPDEDISSTRSEGGGVAFNFNRITYSNAGNTEQSAGIKRVFHLFNTGVRQKEEPVELTIWDWSGDLRYIKFTDIMGNELENQITEGKCECWAHEFFKVIVYVKLPAAGYTTIIMDEAEPSEYRLYYKEQKRTSTPSGNHILENDYIRAELNYKNGELISYIDKQSGKEWIKPGESAGLRYMETERGTSNAWHIGNYTSSEFMFEIKNMRPFQSGELRKGVEIEYKFNSSYMNVKIILDKNQKYLKYNIRADWNDVSRDGSPVPVLLFVTPLNDEIKEYLYNVPAGVQYRKPIDMDVPGLTYGAAVSNAEAGDAHFPAGQEASAFAIITDCKYGYRGIDNCLISTLINSTTNPDPYPDRGIHNINLALTAGTADPIELETLAYEATHITNYQSSMPHKGKLPAEMSMMKFESNSSVLSSVTMAQNGNLLIRAYEVSGNTDKITVSFDSLSVLKNKIKSADVVNLDGSKNGTEIIVKDNRVYFEIEPYCIQAVEIEF